MAFFVRFFSFVAVCWRLLRAPFLIAVGFAIGFVLPYTVWLDREVRSRFDAATASASLGYTSKWTCGQRPEYAPGKTVVNSTQPSSSVTCTPRR